MTERDKYIEIIQTKLTDRDILEGIAEEAAELSKAAIKLIRARGLSNNKTPVKRVEAMTNFQEEIIDLLATIDVWGLDLETTIKEESSYWKWKRWAERLTGENMQGKSEEENEGTKPGIAGSGMAHWYVCGKCKLAINLKDTFCRECGTKIKWSEVEK